MRFLTSSESSCRSERRYKLSRCWLIHSAAAFPTGLGDLRLSLRAHCRLLRRSTGCSAGSPPAGCRPWVLPPPAARGPQDPFTSRVSSQSSMLTEIWDWPRQEGVRAGEAGPRRGRALLGTGGGWAQGPGTRCFPSPSGEGAPGRSLPPEPPSAWPPALTAGLSPSAGWARMAASHLWALFLRVPSGPCMS